MSRKFTVDAKKKVEARTIDKWNHRTEEYEPTEVPDDWNVATYADMDEEVNCVNCGKPLPFSETYTSRRYHNRAGLGYAECPECYEEQFLDELGAGTIQSTTDITAAADDKEDPRIEEVDILRDSVEDDFDYVLAGIDRLARLGLYDDATSILSSLSDTLNSAIGIIGSDFEAGTEPGEEL